MSVSFNLKGSDWAAEKQQNCSGEEAEYWSKLENYSKKKLWHQMTNVRHLTHNNVLIRVGIQGPGCPSA